MQTWTSLPKSSNAAIVQVKESEKDLVVIISKSVTLALLQIALCDPNFTVSGYLGGTVTDSYIHISHLTCHRILRDALTHTDSVLTEAYNEAIAKFNSLNLSCLGWWKTVDPIYPLAPVLFDVARQAALESIFPFSVCLLVHVISTNNPSLYYPIHPPTALSDSLHDPTFNMLVFKTTSALLPPANRQSPHHLLVHENLHVLSLPIYTIAEDYVSPYVLREIQLFLLIVLNESRLLYTANSFEYPPVSKSTSRHLLDSAYDNHLTLFYRYSIGPTIRQVDMEYTAITTKSSILKKRLSALFSRYGELCDWDVDMQTEIALLKNNITIHCETSNSTRNSRLNELVDKVLKGQVEVYTPLVPRASFLNFVTALEKRPIIYLNEAANVDHGIGTLVKKKVVLKKKEDGISKDVKKKK